MASLKPTLRGRATSAPETSADDQVIADPRETPGSYLMNADGTFVVLPAETSTDVDPASSVPVDQDPAETPGSYVAEADGTFTPDAVSTVIEEGPSPAAPAPVLPIESARGISDALDVMGQDIPSVVTAALDAAAPAEVQDTAPAEPTPTDPAPADLSPAASTDQPSAPSPTGDL